MSEEQRPPQTPLDEIPVEELIRLTRAFTQRITNQDRQRLAVDLKESGHQRILQISAPITLQQFFSGEIDLDAELARRYANAPLLSYVKFIPKRGKPLSRQATALFSSQDDSAIVTIDAPLDDDPDATLTFTFTLRGALGLRFRLEALDRADRRRWLDLMRRDNGIAFLWTQDRWEDAYLIFVIREMFARFYAFSPNGYEAAARLTPEMVDELTGWLEDLWFPGARDADLPSQEPTIDEARTWEQTVADRAQLDTARLPPDMPEEQGDDAAEYVTGDDDDEYADDLAPDDLEW
jgi:hypothetical protein